MNRRCCTALLCGRAVACGGVGVRGRHHQLGTTLVSAGCASHVGTNFFLVSSTSSRSPTLRVRPVGAGAAAEAAAAAAVTSKSESKSGALTGDSRAPKYTLPSTARRARRVGVGWESGRNAPVAGSICSLYYTQMRTKTQMLQQEKRQSESARTDGMEHRSHGLTTSNTAGRCGGAAAAAAARAGAGAAVN